MPTALCNIQTDRELSSSALCRSLWLCLLLLPALATASQNLEAQRAVFVSAERALAAGDSGHYRQLKASLKSYPLYPYLEFRELASGLSQTDSSRMERFLTAYAGTPLAWRMRRLWLTDLARRDKWWTYLAFYQPRMGITLQCHYLTALLETGKHSEALDRTPPVWLHGESRPKACDPALEHWIEAGRLTPTLAWERVELAMQAGQGGLANYLKRFLSEPQQQWLATWRELRRHPQRITRPLHEIAASPSRNVMLLDGLKRLVRQDIDAAMGAWTQLQTAYDFDPKIRYQAERSLALGVLRDDPQRLLDGSIDFTPHDKDLYFHESRLRAALKQRAWPRLLEWVTQLPDTLRNSDRWRYWQARAVAELGDQQRALTLYAALAGERSYHGFLAADVLGRPYRYAPSAIELEQSGIDRLATRPALLRARELFQLGRFIDARREWRMAVRDLQALDLKRVSKLAQSWGWHDQAIFTLARTGYWDDLVLRFPLEHRALVAERSASTDLDKSWVFAVIRQESAFSPDARSPAGALGLMQLMPGTARFIARKTQLSPPKRHQLSQPALNITLGTAYLRDVYQRLGENQVLATAAYNAGPRNVRRWLPENTLPADIWIELIPFSETRRYTERVLSYTAIYDQRLGQPLRRLAARMPVVHSTERLAAKDVSEKNAAL